MTNTPPFMPIHGNDTINTKRLPVMLTRPLIFILFDAEGNEIAEPTFPAGTRVALDGIEPGEDLPLSLVVPGCNMHIMASWDAVRPVIS